MTEASPRSPPPPRSQHSSEMFVQKSSVLRNSYGSQQNPQARELMTVGGESDVCQTEELKEISFIFHTSVKKHTVTKKNLT